MLYITIYKMNKICLNQICFETFWLACNTLDQVASDSIISHLPWSDKV